MYQFCSPLVTVLLGYLFSERPRCACTCWPLVVWQTALSFDVHFALFLNEALLAAPVCQVATAFHALPFTSCRRAATSLMPCGTGALLTCCCHSYWYYVHSMVNFTTQASRQGHQQHRDATHPILAAVLLATVLLSSIVSYSQERAASNVMASLQGLLPSTCTVVRDGTGTVLCTRALVICCVEDVLRPSGAALRCCSPGKLLAAAPPLSCLAALFIFPALAAAS